MIKRRVISSLAMLALMFAGGAAAYTLYTRTNEAYKGYTTPEQFVTIDPGSSSRAITQRRF